MNKQQSCYLLIVPYGIETFYYICKLLHKHLLIVPYGIETKDISPLG